MRLLTFAASNLMRRPARTVLTIAGIALAIGTAVALLALGRGITESLSQGFSERDTELIVAPRSIVDVTAMRLPEAMASDLASIEGVKTVTAELFAFSATADGQHVLVTGWHPDAPDWKGAPLVSGRLPEVGASEVLLGDIVAQTLSARTGDIVELFDEEFLVSGVTGYGTPMNRGMAIMSLRHLQEATFREGQVSYFTVQLETGLDAAQMADVRRRIGDSLPVVVSDMHELADQLQKDRNIAVLRAVSSAISSVAIIMGALNLLSTLLLSVQERTREIGMLAAIGWSDWQVVRLIVLEGLCIGLTGSVAGVAIGVVASHFFGSIPSIGDFIGFAPQPRDILLPVLFAVPLSALGAAYPAWRAVRMPPAQALRQT